tara:strand:+ start:101 stop:226 length:126 start_codon:yes stop_codon:yes gene_type:complete
MGLIQITTHIKDTMSVNEQFDEITNLLERAGYKITHMEAFK